MLEWNADIAFVWPVSTAVRVLCLCQKQRVHYLAALCTDVQVFLKKAIPLRSLLHAQRVQVPSIHLGFLKPYP